MTNDVRALLWKEWRSLLRQPGSSLRMAITVAIPITYFGVVGPLQAGEAFVTGPEPWLIAVVLPLLTVVLVAPDSFAGERERRTLRTLLASRLSDSTILWSKVTFAVVLGMGLMVLTLVLAVVVVNLVADASGVVLIPAGSLALMVGVSLLLTMTAAGAAVLISLRAQTVQQAQQLLAAAFFVIPTVLGPVVLLLSDDGDFRLIEDVFGRLGSPMGRLGLLTGLGVLALGLLVAARRSFRRSRLCS